jgi:pyruvate/2-oxoglutarate dehydrogenase complex dihydrolipoamide dehydrogenase (E3) component
MKGLVEARGDHILGFAMIGAEAGEVAAMVQTAMLAGMPYTGLRDAIITHANHGGGTRRTVLEHTGPIGPKRPHLPSV